MPFSIDRLGPELNNQLAVQPTFVRLSDDNRVHTEWLGYGHIYGENDFIYSPEEGLARNADDARDVVPMKEPPDDSSDRLLLGFRSSICASAKADRHYCMYYEYPDEWVPLAADMKCRRPWRWER